MWNTLIFSVLIVLNILFLGCLVWLYVKKRGLEQSGLRKLEGQKTEFVSLLAHYLLTPLTVIRGTISELVDVETSKLTPSQLRAYYLNIQSSANQLLMLVQNITVLNLIDQQELKANYSMVKVLDLVDGCLTDLYAEAEQKKISIKFHRPEGLLVEQVQWDKEKIKQALVNILSNSVKFTAAGGQIEVSLMEEQDCFIILVSDSGIGIAPEEQGKLFVRFHRGASYLNMDYPGVGLGLYLAKYLIKVNNGMLEVKSAMGKGTEVKITLPK